MSTRLEKKLEKIQDLLTKLATESEKGKPILVEGNNDATALRKLAITGRIVRAKATQKSLIDTLDHIIETGEPEIILLMDFDRRGREWTKRIAKHLQETKIKPNALFWKRLLKLVGRNVKDIEGLVTYLETLKKKTN